MTSSSDDLNQQCSTLPLVEPLPETLSSVEIFKRLSDLPNVVFFDSASHSAGAGRYSYIAADPFEWITLPVGCANPFDQVRKIIARFPQSTRADLPPFQAGIAGVLGFELATSLEDLPAARIDDFRLPAVALGCYDVVIASDHLQGRSWIISQGFPETEEKKRQERAAARLTWMRAQLAREKISVTAPPRFQIPLAGLAPSFDVGMGEVRSNMSAANYLRMVERAVEYIHAGDLFQVNLAQRLLAPARSSASSLYLQMRNSNPAPYSGYFDGGEWQLCSTSPECFLQVQGDQVTTRPIKGTRGRTRWPEADLFTGDELQMSEKDRAENVMIVDLMRNDLSQTCDPESVCVSQLCRLETFAHVKHLVSEVCGRLSASQTPLDLLEKCFPGGSITGAPKIRAIEIIAELEPTVRGPYCGSLMYLGFDGQMDSSILIRTVTAAGGWWQLPVGGGIVAQSIADEEYRETWHKAAGVLEVLRGRTSFA